MMTTKKCVQCEQEFTITDSEIKFYQNKGLSIPKRCKACREQNKKRESTQQGTSKTPKKGLLTTLAVIFLGILGIFFNTTDKVPNGNASLVEQTQTKAYSFRNENALTGHFKKHKDEFDFVNATEYLQGANRVINHKDSLHKLEAEDGDNVYYLEATNELVIVSKDGYIRTYFKPSDKINYYNRK